MSLTLYYAPATRAGRVRWLLEELAVPYELRRVDTKAGEQRTPAYLAVNPLGLVPTLLVDGTPMIESGAMLVYLADRFPGPAGDRLAPALDAPERAAFLQWIFFNATTLEPPLLDAYFPSGGPSREAPSPEVKARAIAAFDVAARHVATPLRDGRPFLLGDHLSAADVAVGSVLGWARGAGALAEHPALLDYGRRLGARPAAKAARAD